MEEISQPKKEVQHFCECVREHVDKSFDRKCCQFDGTTGMFVRFATLQQKGN